MSGRFKKISICYEWQILGKKQYLLWVADFRKKQYMLWVADFRKNNICYEWQILGKKQYLLWVADFRKKQYLLWVADFRKKQYLAYLEVTWSILDQCSAATWKFPNSVRSASRFIFVSYWRASLHFISSTTSLRTSLRTITISECVQFCNSWWWVISRPKHV